MPLILLYEADRAAILLHFQKYDADSVAVLLFLLLYQTDFVAFILFIRLYSAAIPLVILVWGRVCCRNGGIHR